MTLLIANVGLNTTLGNTLFVLVSFIVLMLLLKKFAWKNISDILTQRQEKIETDLTIAEQKRQEAETIQAQADQIIRDAHKEARMTIEKAQQQATQQQRELIAEGQQVVANMKEQASREIATLKQEYITNMEQQIGELAVALASKIIQKEMDPTTHQKLIEEFIEGLEM